MPIIGVTASSLSSLSFRPSTLSNLAYWLDASQASSLSLTSGAVSQWSDVSGNSRHFTQSTSNRRPVLDNGGVYFNGNSQFLETALHSVTSNSLSVFMVVDVVGRGTGSTNYGRFYSLSAVGQNDYDNSNGILLHDRAPGNSGLSLYRNGDIGTMAQIPLNTKFVVGFTLSGANALIYRNSTTLAGITGASPTLNATRTIIATDPPAIDSNLNGRIYEAAVYDRALTTTEAGSMVQYMRTKWNVTS